MCLCVYVTHYVELLDNNSSGSNIFCKRNPFLLTSPKTILESMTVAATPNLSALMRHACDVFSEPPCHPY